MKNVKNIKGLLIFFMCLIVASFVFFVLLTIDGTKIGRNGSRLSKSIELIRTFGLLERSSEFRNLGQSSDFLQPHFDILVNALETNLDLEGRSLTISERIEIISVLARSRQKDKSPTSLILSLLKSDNLLLKQEALLALKRQGSVLESVEDTLSILCNEDRDSDISIYACVLIQSLGAEMSQESSLRVQTFAQNTRTSLDSFYQELKSEGINFQLNLERVRDVFYRVSLLGEGAFELKDVLKELAESEIPQEIRIASIRSISDVLRKDNSKEERDVIQFLSSLMQYDSSSSVREEAIIALVYMGTEESLVHAKSYGHKFVKGEKKPKEVEPHPFRSWILENTQNEQTTKSE